MKESISYWQRILMQEVEEEKELSPKQKKIAKLDPPEDKIDAGDFKALRAGKKPKMENQDHEVSMANNSLETIIKAATELKAKLGREEKDIPAWIQDHITNAENFITQASQNYHEYSDDAMYEEEDDTETNKPANDYFKRRSKEDSSYFGINRNTDDEDDDEYVSDYSRRRAKEDGKPSFRDLMEYLIKKRNKNSK